MERFSMAIATAIPIPIPSVLGNRFIFEAAAGGMVYTIVSSYERRLKKPSDKWRCNRSEPRETERSNIRRQLVVRQFPSAIGSQYLSAHRYCDSKRVFSIPVSSP